MKVYIVTSNDYSNECHRNEAVFSTNEKAMEYCAYHSDCDIEEFEMDADYEKKETLWMVTFDFDNGTILTVDNEYHSQRFIDTLHFMACPSSHAYYIPELAPCLAIYVLADTDEHAKQKAKEIYEELVEFTVRGNHKDFVPMMRRCYHPRKYPVYDYNSWICKDWFEQF